MPIFSVSLARLLLLHQSLSHSTSSVYVYANAEAAAATAARAVDTMHKLNNAKRIGNKRNQRTTNKLKRMHTAEKTDVHMRDTNTPEWNLACHALVWAFRWPIKSHKFYACC